MGHLISPADKLGCRSSVVVYASTSSGNRLLEKGSWGEEHEQEERKEQEEGAGGQLGRPVTSVLLAEAHLTLPKNMDR